PRASCSRASTNRPKQAAVTAALARLRETAEGTGNVLPPMKEALRARATVGEVCGALRDVWGTYVPADAV
ncbi:methylmalonyl-CoA mutase family protein, partial [Streptomyces albidus (ex Kaewkla and Franco 2022)]|uniref:methylmalonyl-CoA mutase family protein n=1 Tax=Streptomyces albidus (ex Kaewkla and Franco 2022) TaxID=722709 RepID=UPI001F2D3E05